MKALPLLVAVLLLSACGDNARKRQMEAMEREIARRVELRSDMQAERKLASTRMTILGSIALIGIVVLCSTRDGAPEDRERLLPSAAPQPRDPSRRGERRVIDIVP